MTRDALDGLRDWKREAMVVLDEWEQVWEAAGKPGRLGTSKAAAVRARLITPEIEAVLAAVSAWKPYDVALGDGGSTVDEIDWEGLAEAEQGLADAWAAYLASRGAS